MYNSFVYISEWKFNLAEKRGIAVLVTCNYMNQNTSTYTTLTETKADAKEMKATFEQFNYDIKSLMNEKATRRAVTALLEQLSDYLKDYSGDIWNDNGRKVIIFAFSGHGNESQVVTNDCKPLLLDTFMNPLVNVNTEIPKLFIINVYCERKVMNVRCAPSIEDNYRIDYAIIQDPKASGGDEISWMPKVARALRETDDQYQKIMNMHGVNQEIKPIDRLVTGPLLLYFKIGMDLSGRVRELYTVQIYTFLVLLTYSIYLYLITHSFGVFWVLK